MLKPLDIIVPVYNEEIAIVRKTVKTLKRVFHGEKGVTIIIVDDGSDTSFCVDDIQHEQGVVLVKHDSNKGYGMALKTGILSGSAPWIGITDADGTYPLEIYPQLVADMEHADMVVGIRTGAMNQMPFARRFPKFILNRFAGYLAGVTIRDLNSGMRIFSRELCYSLWSLFPAGFSFTSTLTMGALLSGFRTREHPIDYYKRTGKSSLRPVRDTFRFFFYALRIGLLFYPMKIFGPVAGFMILAGFIKGILRDYLLLGHVGNLAITFMLMAVQLFMLGLLGELIVHSRNFKQKNPRDS